MVHLLLAALQIVWSGPGDAAPGKQVTPAVVWRPLAVRRPARPAVLYATENGLPVEVQWSVTPDDGAIFSDDLAQHVYPAFGSTLVDAGQYRGAIVVRASRGSVEATLPAYVYDTMAVGCIMNVSNGLRFEDDGVARPAGAPAESDIFMTGDAPHTLTPWQGCTGPFISARPNIDRELHVPLGGTIARGIAFTAVHASMWRDDFTIAPPLQPGDVLLFRTRSGRVVKFLCAPRDFAMGPYITTGAGKEFADYAYYVHHPYTPHAVFGPHGK